MLLLTVDLLVIKHFIFARCCKKIHLCWQLLPCFKEFIDVSVVHVLCTFKLVIAQMGKLQGDSV